MVCEHLSALEEALLSSGAKLTYRGQAWSRNCREWVYFDVRLNTRRIRERFQLGPTISDHENADPRSGIEAGLVCDPCHDGIMGNPRRLRAFP